ncbi:aldo/keto reductase [Castellaniella sp. GW247-6E4]|uniref:aldo/keto reductase n=1 Tax=Castellaniella sp. GW247-6E4 TaxID=3140380 RepID=UPI0033160D5C
MIAPKRRRIKLIKDSNMDTRPLGTTGLDIAPMVFGGNVFGWTVDEQASFSLLDALLDSGLNAVDTADSYSKWVAGNQGGESETIIGNWLSRNPGRRDRITLITKVGSELGPTKKGLSRRWITQAVEDSLRRLKTDYIDLYLSHWPDPDTPIEETLSAFQSLREAGKIRAIGASNLNAGQLSDALAAAEAHGLPRYDVLQPEYNLYDRSGFDGALRDLTRKEHIGVITYYSLASGFLSGKYRSQADLAKSPRGQGAAKYLDERGHRILSALDQVSSALDAHPAEVALAWIIAQDGITAPIASATNLHQLSSLVRATQLTLGSEHLALLDGLRV